MSRKLVLYHANCWDGFCAAWVCRKVYPDAEFQAVQYGQQPPDVTGREVLIVDFSYPREQLLAMKESAKNLHVLDHHKTAEVALRDLAFCTFDLSKSGGRLAWEHFFPGQKSPGIVDYTEDRDLWTWFIPGSKSVNAALRSYPLNFEIWDEFGKLSALELFERLGCEGNAILRVEAEIVRSHVRNAHEIELDGHRVLCVNATTLISEIGGELAKDRPFGVTWFEGDNNERVYSLRSRDGGIDVSAIAKAHGGGGHRNAAGFRAPATGATGLFTDGKVNADDEGELKLMIAADLSAGIVRIDFGKPVAWLGLQKDNAIQIGNGIITKAKLLP